jgi:hypothetical protein
LNIMEKLLPWIQDGNDDVADEKSEERKRQERNHGPVKMRTMSNGQVRRAILRQQKTAERKRAKAYRRRWMDNRQAIAALRGQLEVVAAIKNSSGLYRVGQSPELMRITHEHLTKVYGSVDAAVAHYEAIMAEAGA